MDIRDEHGRLLGWLDRNILPAGVARIKWFGFGINQPPENGTPVVLWFRWPIVSDLANGWTAIVCLDLKGLEGLPDFVKLSDDTLPRWIPPQPGPPHRMRAWRKGQEGQ